MTSTKSWAILGILPSFIAIEPSAAAQAQPASGTRQPIVLVTRVILDLDGGLHLT